MHSLSRARSVSIARYSNAEQSL